MRRLLWLPVVALLVLAARWLCYALAAPSPLSGRLEASAGGPRMVVVTLVSASLAVALSVFAVWLAALGVRELLRQRLEAQVPETTPSFPETPASRPAFLRPRPRGPPLPA